MFPEARIDTLVAKINWADTAAPVDYERDLFAEIPRRRTHRGGFDPEPLPEGIQAALKDEALKEGARLLILSDEARRNALACVVEAGEYATRVNSASARELARWASAPGSARRDGVPATAYPARPDRIEPNFPARDFSRGHDWGLPADRCRPPGLVGRHRGDPDDGRGSARGLGGGRPGSAEDAAVRGDLRRLRRAA